MTDTTTPAELEIPDAAKDQAFACGCARLDCRREGYQDDALPIIVAAELRRMADEIADHDWSPAEDGPQVCGECGTLAVWPEPCPTETDDDGPCCIAYVTSAGRDHIPDCHA